MSTLKKHIPNALSLSRVFIFPPILFYICYFLPLGHLIFLYVGLSAGYTDWADGHYARKWKVISEWGKILDPLGDKICTLSIVLPLLIVGTLPLWLGIIIIFRDAAIVLGSAYVMIKRTDYKAIPSKFSGKVAFTVICFTILIFYYQIEFLIPIFSFSSLAVFIWSLADYSQVFFIKMHNMQI